jgi:plastocyanin
VPTGFHSVDIPTTGGDPLPFLSPTGQKVANSNDAAGQPFWFNGQDMMGINPALFESGFGKKRDYNGTKSILSGAPLAPNLKPMTVRFRKAGTVRYFCNIHPGMNGTVKVVAKRKRVSTPRADKRKVRREVARHLTAAKRLAGTQPPVNTVSVGVADRNGAELFAMVPDKLTVPVGTTLTFAMDPDSRDVHTATTGPGDPAKEPESYLGKISASFQAPVFDPIGVYMSTPPAAPSTVTKTSHGNGLWNSGALDSVAASPLPGSSAVKFDAAGVYDFWCLIHSDMHAAITVQ